MIDRFHRLKIPCPTFSRKFPFSLYIIPHTSHGMFSWSCPSEPLDESDWSRQSYPSLYSHTSLSSEILSSFCISFSLFFSPVLSSLFSHTPLSSERIFLLHLICLNLLPCALLLKNLHNCNHPSNRLYA